MKKKFLTMMLFFAFLFAGIQNVNAQYVSESQAMVLVQTEIQTIENNPVDPTAEDKTSAHVAQAQKLEFLQAVNLHLQDGQSVADAIIHGVHDAAVADYVVEPTTDAGDVFRTPLHQEVVDLLLL